MDGRINRVRYEDEEERCDVCQEGDAMMDELEAQRQACIQGGHQKQDRSMDSAINMLISNIPFP